jgi:hypothetical protein
VAGAVALTVGTFGGLAAITALPASAAVLTTKSYTIGAPAAAVTNVTVSPTSATGSTATGFVVKFTATHALSNASGDSVTLSFSPALGTAPATPTLIDDTASTCFQSGANGGADTVSTLTIILSATCSIASGDTVEVDFTTTTPAAALSPLAITVSTSENSAASAVNVTLTSVPPTVTASTQAFGAIGTYTLSGVPIAGIAAPGTTNTVTITAFACGAAHPAPCTADGNTGTGVVTFQNGGAYTVTYTPSGGSATADAVTAASAPAPGNVLTLTLTNAIANAGTLTISGPGVNPAASTPTSEDYFTIQPDAGTIETTTNTVVYGTAVTLVTVAPSPSVAGASATYVVSFKSTDGVPLGGTITLTESAGPTVFTSETGVLVTDQTAGWHCVISAGNLAFPANGLKITLTAGDGCGTVSAGDVVNITVGGVTNPPAGSVSDFDVSTSADNVIAPASPFAIGPSGSAGITVALSNYAASATGVTYTISNFFAGAALAAGTAITLSAPAGTLLPDAPGFYVITDNTTASGSAPAAAITAWSGNAVTFTTANAINSGDMLTLTISDVSNPSTAASDTITLTGLLSGPSAIAPFPDANVTYPNGSIIDFAGTDYVFAGGHPFGIATPTLLLKLESVDHATVQKAAVGATVPTAAPRPGTLITTNTINGNATIYVVGTDGLLHGFVTSQSFLGNGYDPALTITVPNLGGLTMGGTASVLGASASALATSADGAIVDSSGTYYVFDGGKAFGIPTPAWLAVVRKVDTATPLSGTITATQTGATIATGVLLTQNGEVYVAYVGNIFGFKTEAQFSADGYSGTASVTVPNLGGLAVVTGYSGS